MDKKIQTHKSSGISPLRFFPLLLCFLGFTSLALNCERRADDVDLLDPEGQITMKVDGLTWFSSEATASVTKDSLNDSTGTGATIATISAVHNDGSSIVIVLPELKPTTYAISPTSFAQITFISTNERKRGTFSTQLATRARSTLTITAIDYDKQLIRATFDATVQDSLGNIIRLELGRVNKVLSSTPIPPPQITPVLKGKFQHYNFDAGRNVTYAIQDSTFLVTGFNTRDSTYARLRVPRMAKVGEYPVDSVLYYFELENRLGQKWGAISGTVKIEKVAVNSMQGTFAGRAFSPTDSTFRNVTNGVFGFNF
jgi:hypothetical protein